MTRRTIIDPADVAEVERLSARTLSPEEFAAWADGPIAPQEMADMVELIRWFVSRYPTPGERLRSARRRQVQLARTVAHARASAAPKPER